MKVDVRGESELRISELGDPGFDVVAAAGVAFGPLQMFAASLGLCTASVLLEWGEPVTLRSHARHRSR